MSEAGKDTVYVDVDDEITAIIDKVAGSKHKIVALVLPKRAAVLQSIVNMKLLKRSGDAHKKKLVLITSESSLLPLAGAVKLHVAKTLQSKPEIPEAPDVPSDELALDDHEETEVPAPASAAAKTAEEPKEKVIDKSKSVGELATGKKAAALDAEETIELDNEPEDEAPKPAAKKGKNDKKLKIPNFNSFRTKLFVGLGVMLVLIIGWYITNVVLPTATIVIRSDEIDVTANVTFTANTAVKDLDVKKKLVPATEKQVKKVDTEKVPATGKKNVGEKATGSVDLRLTNCAQDNVTVPSGTVVSNNGLNFVTQKDISFSSFKVGGTCANNNPFAVEFTTGSVKVVAQDPGDQYNLSGGRQYVVAGFSNIAGTDSTAMTGGSTKEVTVVSDQDVAAAKQKLAEKSKAAALSELEADLEKDKLFSLAETFAGDEPALNPLPAVGSEASEVSVTSTITFRLLGVKREHLKALVTDNVKDEIDTEKQSVRNDGLGEAVFRVTERKSPTEQVLSVQSSASTGPAIDEEALKQEVAGKKKGQVRDLILARPSIKDVEVRYSPFWVYKTPSKPTKITIEFENSNNASD